MNRLSSSRDGKAAPRRSQEGSGSPRGGGWQQGLCPSLAQSVVAPTGSGLGVQQERRIQGDPLADTGRVFLGGQAQNKGQTDDSYCHFGTSLKQFSFYWENRIPVLDHSTELKFKGPTSCSLSVVRFLVTQPF